MPLSQCILIVVGLATGGIVPDVIQDVPDSVLVGAPKANQFLSSLPPYPVIQYTDFSSTIHRRTPLLDSSPLENEIFERVIQPYNVNAFQHYLCKHDLTNSYPLLVQNLRHGFPIGNMPKLEHTVIIPNHSSVHQNLDVVMNYISTEVGANRMTGPFSQLETERILRGPFYASPLLVSISDQGPNLPPKCRVCRNLSKGDRISGMPSVNSFIDKKDFPTRFDMAFRVADAVSLSHSTFSQFSVL